MCTTPENSPIESDISPVKLGPSNLPTLFDVGNCTDTFEHRQTRRPAYRITRWCGFGTSAYGSFWERRTSKRLEGPHPATIFSFYPRVPNVGCRSTRPSWIQLISLYSITLNGLGPDLGPQPSVAVVRADRSQETTGYNPRSKIIEGGSWTRVDLHREHGVHVLLAA